MNKERIAQLLVLTFIAGTTVLADMEPAIEEIAQAYHLSEDKEEKKALAAKFKELTTAYNNEAKSGVYHTDVKKVKITSVVTDSKNPTPGEVKTYRKPKDLSDTEKNEILALVDGGTKRSEVATKYNVHPSTISDIITAKKKASAPASEQPAAEQPAAEQPAQ